MSEHVVLGHGEVGTAIATLLDADWIDAQSPRSASPGDYDLPPRDPSPQRLAVLAENP